MNETLKLLDMNLNRASEGLRTIEDVARLVRPDNAVAGLVKSLRHDLGQASQRLNRLDRLASRNVRLDQGTGSQNPSEFTRQSWQGVVSAAAERTTQSLRCLEEFSKQVPQEAAQENPDSVPLAEVFKRLRYRAYDDLAFAEQRLSHRAFPTAARLYLLVDCAQPKKQFAELIERLSIAGVDVFQLRDKHAEADALVEYSRIALQAIKAAGKQRDEPSLFIVNDRVDVAVAVNADGVHLGQEDLSIRDARAILPAGKYVGVSTHDDQQVQDAVDSGADYIGCGPTFASRTKQFESFAGLDFIKSASGLTTVPNYAIGGIQLESLDEVMACGCTGVAVSAAINAEPDPVAAAEQFAAKLKEVMVESDG